MPTIEAYEVSGGGAGEVKGGWAGTRSWRKSAQDLLRDDEGNCKLSKEYLKQLCKEMKQYTTPYLNDQLYLHFKGPPALLGAAWHTGGRTEGSGRAAPDRPSSLPPSGWWPAPTNTAAFLFVCSWSVIGPREVTCVQGESASLATAPAAVCPCVCVPRARG